MPPAVSFSRFLGLDRTVKWLLLTRLLQMSVGPINALMIIHFLTPENQGLFYTFASLIGVQAFFELGSGYVMMQLTSHLTAEIDHGVASERKTAATARLSSLVRQGACWYSIAAIAYIVALIVGGTLFISRSHAFTADNGALPWRIAVIASGVLLLTSPFFSVLEGRGLMAEVAKVRLCQALSSAVAMALGLSLGLGLNAFALGSVTNAAVAAGLLAKLHGRYFLELWKAHDSRHSVRWFNEVVPFQWRIAASWMAGYVLFNSPVPILFSMRGAAEAGRLGLTQQVVGAIGSISLVWVSSKAPMFGSLIAQAKFADLDRAFMTSLWRAVAVAVGGSVLIGGMFFLLRVYRPDLAGRLVDAPAFVALLVCGVCNLFISSFAIYLRAYKRDPLVWVSIGAAGLVFLVSPLVAKSSGALGLILVYGAVWCVGGFAWAYWLTAEQRRKAAGTGYAVAI